ncbi:alpha/beta fold hydrolase [Glutamicibacter sp. MNS18]|uniref:alpha/beta fold hydrolase n=1 Tax=Glutamicibacter sp. MNS18 TaxID=2989817 RepID=UPI0022364F91|nr:alpha/beta fold hydrolase [Glutamicibacter sp. MNS18]MCW4467157.1 alpha/beta fold hydrolase [Glutamicibacter sp. MNS18]
MPSVTNPADGTEIFFDDDRADGEAIIFLHGSALSRSIWRGLGYTKALGQGRRTIRIDLRGHGKSDKPHDSDSYTLTLITGDVLAVMDHLDLERAHFVGYSFGSRTALSIALNAPERVLSLSMLGGTYAIESGEIDNLFFDGYLQVLRAGDIEGFVTGQETGGRLDPATRMAFLSNDPLALAAYFESAETQQNIELQQLRELQVPTLLLIGTRDQPRFEHNKVMARTMPNARMVPLVGRTHGGTLYPIEPVVEAIGDLLERARS